MLMTGDLQETFAAYDLILKRDPNDAEGLNLIARYAASAGDAARFNETLVRLRRVPAMQVAAHEPDLLAEAGRIDAAMGRYYKVEEAVPNNPALSLKIGRISVLRHSLPIAEIELKKLEQNDPTYGFHLLKAYLAAQQNARGEAESELKAALAGSRPGDDYWTSAAEIYAMLADTKGVIDSLEKASQRKEPTVSYILINPLFRYLNTDARYQAVKAKLTADQVEMRNALAGL